MREVGARERGGLEAVPVTVRRLAPFLLWLALFYTAWITLVVSGGFADEVAAHWPIAASMAAGSYFAGSTPMGGGTVGFPVLVLAFDAPAALGRNFALAVQSIGMVSASIYILASRKAVDWALLRWTLAGSLVATPLAAAFIAPVASDLFVKLLFAVVWCSFGVIHFLKLRAIVKPEGERIPEPALDRAIGLAIGLCGGVVAALTGVGVDMIVYAFLVLLYRSDIKVAIPTSVILMAATSLIGIGSNLALMGLDSSRYAIQPEVFYNWLAAAPVVALGAPLGALVVSRMPRAPTLLIVSGLCIAQYVWVLAEERVTGLPLAAALGGVLAMNALFLWLFRIGERREAKTHRPLAR